MRWSGSASGGDFSTPPSDPLGCGKALGTSFEGLPRPVWLLWVAARRTPPWPPAAAPPTVATSPTPYRTCACLGPHPPSTCAVQTVNRCARCHCGRVACLGHPTFSTSTHVAQAAQPAYAEPDCVSTDLAARHQVWHAMQRCLYCAGTLHAGPGEGRGVQLSSAAGGMMPPPHPSLCLLLTPGRPPPPPPPPPPACLPACRPCCPTSPPPCRWTTT